MCIEKAPSLQIKLRALGGGGSIFSCPILGVRWEISCVGSADVHCDFLVSLVGVVFSCPGGLLLLWMMSYVRILMASGVVIRVCN